MTKYSKTPTRDLVNKLYAIENEHHRLNVEYNKIIDELVYRIPTLEGQKGFTKVKVREIKRNGSKTK